MMSALVEGFESLELISDPYRSGYSINDAKVPRGEEVFEHLTLQGISNIMEIYDFALSALQSLEGTTMGLRQGPPTNIRNAVVAFCKNIVVGETHDMNLENLQTLYIR